MSPACSPMARLITRSMLSLGTLAARAFSIAYLSFRFESLSGPPWRTADMIARDSLLKLRERFLSTAPLRAAMFAEWEWPAMVQLGASRRRPSRRRPADGAHGSGR